jgi:hypothetical protein
VLIRERSPCYVLWFRRSVEVDDSCVTGVFSTEYVTFVRIDLSLVVVVDEVMFEGGDVSHFAFESGLHDLLVFDVSIPDVGSVGESKYSVDRDARVVGIMKHAQIAAIVEHMIDTTSKHSIQTDKKHVANISTKNFKASPIAPVRFLKRVCNNVI